MRKWYRYQVYGQGNARDAEAARDSQRIRTERLEMEFRLRVLRQAVIRDTTPASVLRGKGC